VKSGLKKEMWWLQGRIQLFLRIGDMVFVKSENDKEKISSFF
jgi:hypothetical protein